MDAQDGWIERWGRDCLHDPLDVDCTTAVMLKILDGKCRMGERDKAVAMRLYDAVRGRPGRLLGTAAHELIARARTGCDDALREAVYEQRLYAETMVGRPLMKAYKARLREAGLLGGGADEK